VETLKKKIKGNESMFSGGKTGKKKKGKGESGVLKGGGALRWSIPSRNQVKGKLVEGVKPVKR